MVALLFCVAITYAMVTVYKVSQKMGLSWSDAILQCPNTWDTLFVLAAILMFFVDSIGLWFVLGSGMGVLWLVAWVTREHESLTTGYQQPQSRWVTLLKSTYPLLAVALLVAVHLRNSYDPIKHPSVTIAQQRQRELEESRRVMEAKLVAMYHHLDKFEVPVTDDTYSMNEIRAMAGDLVKLADDLSKEYNDLVAQREEFVKQVADAPEMFRHAGQVWRQYAMEEQAIGDAGLAGQYTDTVELWEAYAKRAEREREDSYSLKELGQAMFFVGRARVYLTRLVANSPLATGAELLDKKAHFERNVRTFIEQFDDLRMAIRGLTNQLNEDGESADIVDEPEVLLSEAHVSLEDLRPSTPQSLPRMIRELAASTD